MLSREHVQAVRNGLFFIVGNHRGGTTLLQSMLSSHSDITIPPETNFFNEVWPRRAQFECVGSSALARLSVERLQYADYTLSDLHLPVDQVLECLQHTPGEVEDLFVAHLAAWAAARGKQRAGEKTPHHIFQAETIARLLPEAKFIAILRDPRAVVASELQTDWGSRSVTWIVGRWLRTVREDVRLRSCLKSEQYTWLRFEDLLASPAGQLERLCGFLGTKLEPDMLQFHERPADERGFAADERWKENTLRPLQADRSDAWRDRLTSEQVALIEALTGPEMAALNYEPSGATPSAWALTRLRTSDRLQHTWEAIRKLGQSRARRPPWTTTLADLLPRFS